MQQRLQIAMMQYEVFNALHDALAFELSRMPSSAHSQDGSEDRDSGAVSVRDTEKLNGTTAQLNGRSKFGGVPQHAPR